MPDNKAAQNQAYTREDVERTLEAVLKSDQFSSSSQLQDFLKYIVTKTLDGDEAEIKAYTIAVDALGRSDDFDPQNNAAVRVAAGRLRQALTVYGALDDAMKNPVLISLAPGSYVPAFESTLSKVLEDTAPAIKIPKKVATSAPEHGNLSFEEYVPPSPKDPATGALKTAFSEGGDALEKALLSTPNTRDYDPSVAANAPGAKNSRQRAGLNKVVALIGLLVLAGGAIGGYLWSQQNTVAQLSVPPFKAGVAPTAREAQPKEELAPVDVGLRPRIKATLLLASATYPEWFDQPHMADSLGDAIARFSDYQFLGLRTIKSSSTDDTREADYDLMVSVHNRGNEIQFFAQLVRDRDSTVIWSTNLRFAKPTKDMKRDVATLAGRAFAPLGSPYGVIHADILAGGVQRTDVQCVIKSYQYFDAPTDKKHEQARACAETLIEKGSKLPSIRAALTFLYLDEHRAGRNRRNRDPIAAAKAMAESAIRLAPQSARAHQAIFAVHKVQGRIQDAQAEGEKAIQLNPFDTDIIGDYGAWLVSIERYSEGAKMFDLINGLTEVKPAWLAFYEYVAAEMEGKTKKADQLATAMNAERSPLLAAAIAINADRRGDTERSQEALNALVKVQPDYAVDAAAEFEKRGISSKLAGELAERLKAAGIQKFAKQG